MKNKNYALVTIFVFLLLISFAAVDLQAQMSQPEMTTLSGRVIDLTCASKGNAMMNNWRNVEDNHMMPTGEMKSCATMCLKGGQPAALFSGGQITAVFSCNPQATLSNYAAQSVEVQGHWAGAGAAVKPFVPMKIRAGGGSWEDVNCATMH